VSDSDYSDFHAEHHVSGHARHTDSAEQSGRDKAAEDGQANDLQIVQCEFLMLNP
jgi:hypothetical protein